MKSGLRNSQTLRSTLWREARPLLIFYGVLEELVNVLNSTNASVHWAAANDADFRTRGARCAREFANDNSFPRGSVDVTERVPHFRNVVFASAHN